MVYWKWHGITDT